VIGTAFPRWFFRSAPPWPPLHVGQIQIGGVFDLAMATVFLIGATDVGRYASLVLPVGVVAEVGHALVRIGHVVAGDNPREDLVLPSLMLLVGAILVTAAVRRRRRLSVPRSAAAVSP
jgi:hypothetical protein